MISQFALLARLSRERHDLRKAQKFTDFVKGIIVGLGMASAITRELWMEHQERFLISPQYRAACRRKK